MAMDKTTTRRMIGAIVLVLVAALVLAFLLKSKNKQAEVEKVHDVTLPSSPILAFPGAENAAGGNGNAAQQASGDGAQASSADGDKAGLNILPNGLKPAADAVGDAANQAQQEASRAVGSADTGSQDSGAQSQTQGDSKSDSKSASSDGGSKSSDPAKDLKKADVVSLGNDGKVSPNDKKKSDNKKKDHKKPDHQKPRLVHEKRLPKITDKKPKKTTKPKSAEAPKKNSDAGKVAGSGSEIPTTGFSIQLLATSAESKAKAVKKQMLDEGYPAYITSVIKDGNALYRVRVGAYQDHDEADAVQARMKRRYTQNSNVQNSLVVTNK